LRALAVTSAIRSSQLPDTPTVGETVPGYEASALFGMAAPKNTPKEIIEKLNKEINAVQAEPGMQKQLVELGGEPVTGTPEAFGALIVAETEKWKKCDRGRRYQEGGVASSRSSSRQLRNQAATTDRQGSSVRQHRQGV
jgi:tripartite-type tricarboxylate transporter receptor subunit TctC